MNQTTNAITVYTHERPDLDALVSAAILRYLYPRNTFALVFDSKATAAMHDGQSTFVVDIGNGPFDHHHLVKPRSTCATALVAKHYAACGNTHQQHIARVLLQSVAPLVLRQDATGSICNQRDGLANALGLPQIIHRLRRRLCSDQAVWNTVWPLIKDWFDEVVAEDAAKRNAEPRLARLLRFSGNHVVGVVDEHPNDGPRLQLGKLVWQHYPPEVSHLVYVNHWQTPSGATSTWSRGIVRRPGSNHNLQTLLVRLQSHSDLDAEMRGELRRWYAEDWYTGFGSIKFPQVEPPPTQFVERLAAVVDTCTTTTGVYRPQQKAWASTPTYV